MTKKALVLACSVLVFVSGFVVGNIVRAQSDSKRVFELRTYTAPEGELGDLAKRFRDHTMRSFTKQGMENVGYWHPQEAPDSASPLISITSHKRRHRAHQRCAASHA